MAREMSPKEALDIWYNNVERLKPEILRDPVADALRKMAERVFLAYRNKIRRLTAADKEDNAWYEAIADALRILGLRWYDETTEEQDAFVLAYADEIAKRPEMEA